MLFAPRTFLPYFDRSVRDARIYECILYFHVKCGLVRIILCEFYGSYNQESIMNKFCTMYQNDDSDVFIYGFMHFNLEYVVCTVQQVSYMFIFL